MKSLYPFVLAIGCLLIMPDRTTAQSIPIITTIAGDAVGDGGPASNASIKIARAVACDRSGNIYITEDENRVRKINSSGVISTVSGGGFNDDGHPATTARNFNPRGVTIDASGNIIIADVQSINNRIRKVDASGTITTLAGTGTTGYSGDGGPATAANIYAQGSITADASGNVYFADYSYRIRKIAPSGIITTFAGNGTAGYSGDGGPATAAEVYTQSVFCARNGKIYFASQNATIRVINPSTGIVTRFAGNGSYGFSGDGGPSTAASLGAINAISEDKNGNIIFADGFRIRSIDGTGIISTIAGSGVYGFSGDGGPATDGRFSAIIGLATDTFGNIIAIDGKVRKVDTNRYLSTIASELVFNGGAATNASLYIPEYAIDDRNGNILIADRGHNMIRKIDTHGVISTYAGSDTTNVSSGDGGLATAATFKAVLGLTRDNIGNIYIAEYPKIRKIDTSGIISTMAGTGTSGFSGDGGLATAAMIGGPMGLKVDRFGNLYFADFYQHRIRKIDASGIISTLAGTGTAGLSGDGGAATAAMVNYPSGLDIDNAGNVYFTDNFNHRVRKISTTGIITTIAGDTAGYGGNGGPATAALLHLPRGIAIDKVTGNIYVSDFLNSCIRVIDTFGIINAFAGTDTAGCSGDGGPASSARLFGPSGLFFDSSGNMLIADYFAYRIRKIDFSGGHSLISNYLPGTTDSKLVLFPNPNSGTTTIKLTTATNDLAKVVITNILGEKVNEFAMQTNKETVRSFDLPAGVYLIKALTKTETLTGKLVIGK